MAIDFELTPEQWRLRDLGRELAQDFATRARQHDEERSLPVENFARLRDEGLYRIALPKELGRLGVGQIGWTPSPRCSRRATRRRRSPSTCMGTRRAASRSGPRLRRK